MKMEQVHGELELAKSEIERLKFNVSENDSLIQYLTCANNKLRNDSDSKLRKLEHEKIELLKALDEAESANKGQEKAMGVLQSELDNITMMLSASQKKCSDVEQEAKALKEWSLKDDRLGRLEEEGMRKIEQKLKWKNEQFELLVQAHEKLKSESKASKREWELERCSLLDEMSAIQSTLDCQNWEAESLKTQMDRCKQALVLEETRRQGLESQVSEMKTRVSNDCWDVENSLDSRRDNEEMSALRESLHEMESDLKEAEYRAKKLEKENQDLLSTVRELQECHIPKAAPSTPPSTVAKIKSKLRSVEQTHKDCALNLRSKEADWNSQMQMMRRDIEDSRFCLKVKEASIKELKKELDNCNATNTELKLQNEQLSLMLQIQNSGDNGMLDECYRERDGLKQEVEELCGAVENYKEMLDECYRERDGLKQEVEELCGAVENYKEMLDECYRERDGLKQEVKELSGAVENLECELSEKVFEESEIEFELQIWRSASERLRAELEESQRVRGELELSLLAQAGFEEELKLEMYNLKQQVGIVIPEYEDESQTRVVQFLNVAVGKDGIEIRSSVERSPFREIN